MLEQFEFVFWEILKAFALVVLALIAAKAAASFLSKDSRISLRRLFLYGLILVLVGMGARTLGLDVAGEVYGWASQKNLDRHEYALAYRNAARAVDLRPNVLRYWQLLARAKFSLRQFDSLLRDQPAFATLSPDGLDEDDLLRFAYSHYFLGQYGNAASLASQFIERNPAYPKSYVLRALSETALKQYANAERDFMKSLRILPTQADAVEGLAQAYFLDGNTAQAAAVLDATAHYSFPPEQLRRFQALKRMYEQ